MVEELFRQRRMRTLLDLNPGEEGIIKDYKDTALACSLIIFGVLPDTPVKLVRKSPLGSAVCLKLGEYFLAVRKQQASKILIHDVNE